VSLLSIVKVIDLLRQGISNSTTVLNLSLSRNLSLYSRTK